MCQSGSSKSIYIQLGTTFVLVSVFRKVFRTLIQKGGVKVVAGKNIHVVKNGNIWQAKQENAQRSSGNFGTQQAAFERAREIAKNRGQEVAIHGVDGKIRAKHSYGDDPYPPKG